jgi:hypothetical protein
MDLVKIKTKDLWRETLDYAVNVANRCADEGLAPVQYSTRWEFGGTIIEREKLGVWAYQWNEDGEPEAGWYAEDKDGGNVRKGNTPLVAAMRCYVASKLGDEVSVPSLTLIASLRLK